jgi:hypothetical protein
MKPQHLSDEAVAAFADGVLTGSARERARKHTAECPECAYSVAVQREAVWALRAAPAPALPTGLFDRLLDVPSTTPIRVVPASVDSDGSMMFSAVGTLHAAPVAAFVPESKTSGRRTSGPETAESAVSDAGQRHHRLGAAVGVAVAIAAAGVLAVSSSAHATGHDRPAQPAQPVLPASVEQANVQPATYQPALYQPAASHPGR